MQRRRQPVIDLPFKRPGNLPRRRSEAADIDRADIQGNVLRGYTYPTAAYIFLHIDDVDRARALMSATLTEVATAEPWEDGPPPTATHASFTYSGLETLGVPDDILASFPAEFREGMAARAERLGDRGPSAPEHWEPGLGTGEAHVLITVYAIDNEHLDERREVLRQFGQAARRDDGDQRDARRGAGRAARTTSASSTGSRSRRSPAAAWRRARATASPTAPAAGATSCTGEFLHGHIDEDGGLPDAPAAPFDCNGTFEVYRKLQTDVAAFRAYMEEKGRDYPGGPDMLAAKIVGRWSDGTPLVLSPERPDPGIVDDPARINDFSYADDAEGLRCPLGAHIRRANPRDAEGFFKGRMTNRHRIIRRGRTYGPPLPEGVMEDDGAGARARVRVLQREHLAPVRDHPDAVDRRRRPVRARSRQGLPHRRARRRRQDDDPGPSAVLPQAAPALRDDARRRVPVPAEHQRAALDGRAGRRGLVARAEPGGVTARPPSRASAGAPCNRTRRSPAP